MQLPKIFKEADWERLGKPEDITDHIGKPYISYSQLKSFLERREDWITNYLMGKRPSNIWMEFGSEVGKYVELCGKVNFKDFTHLTPEGVKDIQLFDDSHEFEKPVYFFIDVSGHKVLIFGFIDVYKQGEVLIDIKTGNAKSMLKNYGGSNYMQTRLYLYALDDMISPLPKFVGVKGLPRIGRGSKASPLLIKGKTLTIPTDYERKQVEEYLEEIVKPAIIEMEKYYLVYKKIVDE